MPIIIHICYYNRDGANCLSLLPGDKLQTHFGANWLLQCFILGGILGYPIPELTRPNTLKIDHTVLTTNI